MPEPVESRGEVDVLAEQELAETCAQKMWAGDFAAQHLGVKLLKIAPGRAEMTMSIDDRMINGHKICHGGYIFTLADTAFAYACNSRNSFCVAQHCTISFIKPARLDDCLTAIAIERQREGRSGIYDITITNQNGDTIAEFRGSSRTIKGEFVPENTN